MSFSTAARVAVEIPGGLARAIAGMLGLAPPTGDVAGPIGIAQQTGRLLDAPLVSQLFFIGLLSINLAVLNILPFPPLDGGQVLIVVIEGPPAPEDVSRARGAHLFHRLRRPHRARHPHLDPGHRPPAGS